MLSPFVLPLLVSTLARADAPLVYPADGTVGIVPGGFPIAWVDVTCADPTHALSLTLEAPDGTSVAEVQDVPLGTIVSFATLGPFVPSTTYTLRHEWDGWSQTTTFTTTDGATPVPLLTPLLTNLGSTPGAAWFTITPDPVGAGQSWWRMTGTASATGESAEGVDATEYSWWPYTDGEACYTLDQVWLDGSVGGTSEACGDVYVERGPGDTGNEEVLGDCVGLLCGCNAVPEATPNRVALLGLLLPLLRRR